MGEREKERWEIMNRGVPLTPYKQGRGRSGYVNPWWSCYCAVRPPPTPFGYNSGDPFFHLPRVDPMPVYVSNDE